MKLLALAVALYLCLPAEAHPLDPLVEYRYLGTSVREADGTTARSGRVLRAFRKVWACPSTGSKTGPCPGWAIDHAIPLACGGVDAVYNLQWLPDQIKSSAGDFSKDRFERRVYGGNNVSKGCP